MPDHGFKVALIGASTLKGKELKEVLQERSFPVRSLELYDEEDLVGHLTEFRGEPTFVRTIGMDSFRGVRLAFFASAPLFTKNYWKMAEREGAAVIDMTGALEDEVPDVAVAGPLVTGRLPDTTRKIYVAAHPAALAIALVIARISERVALSRAIVNVFEPASERGGAGVDELHKQTVGLLSFQQWPKEVFEAQAAFNMLPVLGEGVRPALAAVEARVVREVRSLLGGPALVPSVRVAQGGSFHGHSLSFYLELAERAPITKLQDALKAAPFDWRGADVEAPSAVGAAASSEVLVGDLRADAACERGYWLWAAADNVRLMAVNAVETAERLVAVGAP